MPPSPPATPHDQAKTLRKRIQARHPHYCNLNSLVTSNVEHAHVECLFRVPGVDYRIPLRSRWSKEIGEIPTFKLPVRPRVIDTSHLDIVFPLLCAADPRVRALGVPVVATVAGSASTSLLEDATTIPDTFPKEITVIFQDPATKNRNAENIRLACDHGRITYGHLAYLVSELIFRSYAGLFNSYEKAIKGLTQCYLQGLKRHDKQRLDFPDIYHAVFVVSET